MSGLLRFSLAMITIPIFLCPSRVLAQKYPNPGRVSTTPQPQELELRRQLGAYGGEGDDFENKIAIALKGIVQPLEKRQPANADHRDRVVLVPAAFPPFNQLRGSCVGHAVATAFSYECAKKRHDLTFKHYTTRMQGKLSNPYWLWDRQIKGNGSIGASSWKALEILAYHGCPTIEAMPLPKNEDDTVLTWQPTNPRQRKRPRSCRSRCGQVSLKALC